VGHSDLAKFPTDSFPDRKVLTEGRLFGNTITESEFRNPVDPENAPGPDVWIGFLDWIEI
jgi:hypothetical protein